MSGWFGEPGAYLGIGAKELEFDNFGYQRFNCISPSATATVTPSDNVREPKQRFVPGIHVAVVGEVWIFFPCRLSESLAILSNAVARVQCDQLRVFQIGVGACLLQSLFSRC